MLVVADDLTTLTGCHYMNSFPLTYIVDQDPSPSCPEPTAALYLMLFSGETDKAFETFLGYSSSALSWRVQR